MYTKGEWEAQRKELAMGIYCGEDLIATVHTRFTSNAQLIASSPRLYEFVKGRADGGDKKAKQLIETLAL